MTEQEWVYYRKHSKPVWEITCRGSYSMCSLLPGGRIKIEGYEPKLIGLLSEQQREKLRAAGVYTNTTRETAMIP